MKQCDRIRAEFSNYLDGAISGVAMQEIASHLEECHGCAAEFAEWRSTQRVLASLGGRKAPENLGLRLRVAVSQESTRSAQARLGRLQIRWQNSVRPVLLQASAGLVSSVLLIGALALLIGMFGAPEPLSARDQPLGAQSEPHFLYSSLQPMAEIGNHDNPIVVEAFINGNGRVYDYKVMSGTVDQKTRTLLDSALLFSVFSPARNFGEPVSGVAVLSFTGVSVRG